MSCTHPESLHPLNCWHLQCQQGNSNSYAASVCLCHPLATTSLKCSHTNLLCAFVQPNPIPVPDTDPVSSQKENQNKKMMPQSCLRLHMPIPGFCYADTPSLLRRRRCDRQVQYLHTRLPLQKTSTTRVWDQQTPTNAISTDPPNRPSLPWPPPAGYTTPDEIEHALAHMFREALRVMTEDDHWVAAEAPMGEKRSCVLLRMATYEFVGGLLWPILPFGKERGLNEDILIELFMELFKARREWWSHPRPPFSVSHSPFSSSSPWQTLRTFQTHARGLWVITMHIWDEYLTCTP